MDHATELIANIAARSAAGDVADAPAQLEELEALATPALLPDLLRALEDEDLGGSLWGLFYIAENMDDAYLEALLDALPGLDERAPRWAETAVIRILNTRGDPEDCTDTFLALANARTQVLRRLIVRILKAIARDEDELVDTQLAAIDHAIAALGGTPRKR